MRGVQRNHGLYARVFVFIIAVQKYGLIWKYNTCIMHMGGLPFSLCDAVYRRSLFSYFLCVCLCLCHCPAKSKSTILALGWTDWAPSLWYAERCWSLSLYLFFSIFVFSFQHTDIVWSENIMFAWVGSLTSSPCYAECRWLFSLYLSLFFSLQHIDII